MIGKTIRSLGHLHRNLEYNIPQYLLLKRIDGQFIEGEVIKINNGSYDQLLFFNSRRGDIFNYHFNNMDETVVKTIDTLSHKYCGFFDFSINDKTSFKFWYQLSNGETYLMPKNFLMDFESFCNNNKKLLSSICEIMGLHIIMKYFYSLTNGSPNMFVWAMNNYKKGVPLNLIVDILYWFNEYGKFNGKLTKGSMTAYNDTKNILKMREELFALRKNKRISSVINMFNTFQKKMLKNSSLTSIQENMLSRFDTLSKEKQLNFIRKVSTIENVEDLFHQMALLTKVHFEWNRESFFDCITNIEGLSFNIVYDNSNIVILEVKDYDTIKYITRTTNWCISKNKRYWNDYMSKERNKGEIKQYVLFDFNQKEDSELSIVGFTTRNHSEIAHAHSFTNKNLISTNFLRHRYDLNTFCVRHRISQDNIFNVLNNLSIPLSCFIESPTPTYEWNRENVMKILSNVDEMHYDIVKDDDNVLIFFLENADAIVQLVGARQYSKIILGESMNSIESKHIFICDFTKETNDKMLCGIVYKYDEIENCHQLYDNSGLKYGGFFDNVIYRHKLPYDIIARPSNELSYVEVGFKTFDKVILQELLPCENIKKMLYKNQQDNDFIVDALRESLYGDYSMDILHILYENGYNLTKLIGKSNVDYLLSTCFEIAALNQKYLKTVPSTTDYIKLMDNTISENKTIGYGMFFIADLIISKEKDIISCKHWIKRISNIKSQNVRQYFLKLLLPQFNKITSKEKMKTIIDLIILSDYNEGLEEINKLGLSDEFNKKIYQSLSKDHPLIHLFVEKANFVNV